MALRRILDEAEIKLPYICCCTAYSEASFKREAFASGMDNFITKPVKVDELEVLIRQNLP